MGRYSGECSKESFERIQKIQENLQKTSVLFSISRMVDFSPLPQRSRKERPRMSSFLEYFSKLF